MIEFVKINIEEILPSIDEIMSGQGIPNGYLLKDNIKGIIDKSINFFLAEADPLSIIKEISNTEFDEIFIGDGNNEEEAPLKSIYRQADYLSLFAITLGSTLSTKISELFDLNDFALASMLDTAASIAADKSIEVLEKHIARNLREQNPTNNGSMVLSYSPGYCGWHIEAQKKLFLHLNPEQIGISLNESCLMTPLKSATGVLISGEKNIHNFDNRFSFCYNCKVQSCIERKEKIFSH